MHSFNYLHKCIITRLEILAEGIQKKSYMQSKFLEYTVFEKSEEF